MADFPIIGIVIMVTLFGVTHVQPPTCHRPLEQASEQKQSLIEDAYGDTAAPASLFSRAEVVVGMKLCHCF